MIRYIKLVSGHEIIGEEVASDGKSYTLRKPMIIEIVDHGGHAMCSLVTYCIATDLVEFNGRYVMQTGSASDAFIETYTRQKQAGDANVFQEPLEEQIEPLYEGEDEDLDDDELHDAVFERLKPTYH